MNTAIHYSVLQAAKLGKKKEEEKGGGWFGGFFGGKKKEKKKEEGADIRKFLCRLVGGGGLWFGGFSDWEKTDIAIVLMKPKPEKNETK